MCSNNVNGGHGSGATCSHLRLFCMLAMGIAVGSCFKEAIFLSYMIPKDWSYQLATPLNPEKKSDEASSNSTILTSAPVPSQPLVTLTENIPLNVSYVIIVSMQRSSSTFLSKAVLGSQPCHVTLNEILSPGPGQSEDAWTTEGIEMGISQDRCTKTDYCTVDIMAKFIQKVAQRRCQEKWQSLPDKGAQCHNHCTANWKHFNVHLPWDQHIPFWKTFYRQLQDHSVIAVQLERPVQERWRSWYFAQSTGDWNTIGTDDHKQKLGEMEIPPVRDAFRQEQNSWFALVNRYFNQTGGIPMLKTKFVDVTNNPMQETREQIGALTRSQF